MADSRQFSVATDASDILNDPVAAAEIFMHENPQLAARQGVDTQLFEQGAHEPAGATVLQGDLKIKTPVKLSRDFEPKASKSSDAVMYVQFGGHTREAERILAKAAAVRGLETVVGVSDKGRKGLAVELSRTEVQSLADLGAKIYNDKKVEITPDAQSKAAIRRSPRPSAPRFDTME